jgi:hypothetical protein
LTLSIQLGLVSSDLLVLTLVLDLLTLHLIANQSARAQAQPSPDQSARSRTADGGTDETSGSGPSECSYPCRLLPR